MLNKYTKNLNGKLQENVDRKSSFIWLRAHSWYSYTTKLPKKLNWKIIVWYCFVWRHYTKTNNLWSGLCQTGKRKPLTTIQTNFLRFSDGSGKGGQSGGEYGLWKNLLKYILWLGALLSENSKCRRDINQTLSLFMYCLLWLPLDSWDKLWGDTCSTLELIPSSGSIFSRVEAAIKEQLVQQQHPPKAECLAMSLEFVRNTNQSTNLPRLATSFSNQKSTSTYS